MRTALFLAGLSLLGGQAPTPTSTASKPAVARIALIDRAFVRSPIWIEVNLPGRMQSSVRYPITIQPQNLGGHRFQVRKSGRDLPNLAPSVQAPMAGGGLGSPGSVGGGTLIGLPHEPAKTGRLPLHLAFRFDEPGVYQVRYTGYDMGFPGAERALVQSPWIDVNVEPLPAAVRNLRKAPTDPVELLSDYLPSALAWPNPEALTVIENALYNDHPLVRQYAMYALYLFDDDLIGKRIPELIRQRGPTEDLAYFLSWRRSMFEPQAVQLVTAILPCLRSSSQISVGGALKALVFLRAHFDWSKHPQTPGRMDEAVLGFGQSLLERGSHDIPVDLAQYLGAVKTDRSRQLLWRLVAQGTTRQQALIALTWIADRRDLPKLATFNFSGFDYHLNRAYGDAVLPYRKK